MFFNIFLQLIIILAWAGICYIFLRKSQGVMQKEKFLLLTSEKIYQKLEVKALLAPGWAKKIFRQILKQIEKILRVISLKNKQFFSLIKKIRKEKQKVALSKEKRTNAVAAMIDEQRYIQVIAADPRNFDAYLKLGELYSRQKNVTDALACFEEVLRLDPSNEIAKASLDALRFTKNRKKLNKNYFAEIGKKLKPM